MFSYRAERVDLNLFPPYTQFTSAGDQIVTLTFGDMHGNALKMLHLFLKYEVITGWSPTEYRRFKRYYAKSSGRIDVALIKKVQALLDQLVINRKRRVILVGDELSDRGRSDIWNMLVLKTLLAKGLDMRTVLSNHGYNFLKLTHEEFKFTESGKLQGNTLDQACSRSAKSLAELLRDGVVMPGEIRQFLYGGYLDTLQAIHYEVDSSGQQVTLVTHAPIDLAIIEQLCKQFDVDYEDASVADLCASIDSVNATIKSHIIADTLHEFVAKEPRKNNAIYKLIWNRNYSKLKRKSSHNGYQIQYVHGHDLLPYYKRSRENDSIIGLDDAVGRTSSQREGLISMLYAEADRLAATQRDRYRFFSPKAQVGMTPLADRPERSSVACSA